jgi:hypothetical protein
MPASTLRVAGVERSFHVARIRKEKEINSISLF